MAAARQTEGLGLLLLLLLFLFSWHQSLPADLGAGRECPLFLGSTLVFKKKNQIKFCLSELRSLGCHISRLSPLPWAEALWLCLAHV